MKLVLINKSGIEMKKTFFFVDSPLQPFTHKHITYGTLDFVFQVANLCILLQQTAQRLEGKTNNIFTKDSKVCLQN